MRVRQLVIPRGVKILFFLLAVWASPLRAQQPAVDLKLREAPWDSPRRSQNLPDRRRNGRERLSSLDHGSDSPALADATEVSPTAPGKQSSRRPATPSAVRDDEKLGWLGWGLLTVLAAGSAILLGIRFEFRRRPLGGTSPTRSGTTRMTVDLLETTLPRRRRSTRTRPASDGSPFADLPPAPPIPEYRRKPQD